MILVLIGASTVRYDSSGAVSFPIELNCYEHSTSSES